MVTELCPVEKQGPWECVDWIAREPMFAGALIAMCNNIHNYVDWLVILVRYRCMAGYIWRMCLGKQQFLRFSATGNRIRAMYAYLDCIQETVLQWPELYSADFVFSARWAGRFSRVPLISIESNPSCITYCYGIWQLVDLEIHMSVKKKSNDLNRTSMQSVVIVIVVTLGTIGRFVQESVVTGGELTRKRLGEDAVDAYNAVLFARLIRWLQIGRVKVRISKAVSQSRSLSIVFVAHFDIRHWMIQNDLHS